MNYLRFWSRVSIPHPDVEPYGCWQWTGHRQNGGYGMTSVGTKKGERKRPLAHRVAWEQFMGPIPDGKQLDHLCRNHACVNPSHLEVVSGRENVVRGIGPTAKNAKKTHCVNGHALTPENLYRHSPAGGRKCKACAIRNAREREKRLRS